MVEQGEIIEVPFRMADGAVEPHPALVISGEIDDSLGSFFYVVLISTKNISPEYTIPITREMLTKPLDKDSYFVTHLIDKFQPSEIIQRRCSRLKKQYIGTVISKVASCLFGLELELE